jgi:hypothetical protein
VREILHMSTRPDHDASILHRIYMSVSTYMHVCGLVTRLPAYSPNRDPGLFSEPGSRIILRTGILDYSPNRDPGLFYEPGTGLHT